MIAAVSASSMSAGISAVVSAVVAQLGERAHEGHVVELLQRALAPAHRRRAPAEHEHRRAVLLGGGHRAHAVGDAGPGGERRHAGLAGDLGPALGGEGGGRLVAHVDEVDALLAAAVVDREQMPARQREELGHPVRLQALGHQPTPVELRGLLGLGAHGRGPYRQMSAPCRSRLWDRARPSAPWGHDHDARPSRAQRAERLSAARPRRPGPRVRRLLPPARLPRSARRGSSRSRRRWTRSSSPGCCIPELGLGLLQPRRVRVEDAAREAMVDHQHALAVGQLRASASALSSAA